MTDKLARAYRQESVLLHLRSPSGGTANVFITVECAEQLLEELTTVVLGERNAYDYVDVPRESLQAVMDYLDMIAISVKTPHGPHTAALKEALK